MSAVDETREPLSPALRIGALARYGPALATLAAFALLAVLVALGKLTRVDQYGVSHLMPSLSPSDSRVSILNGLRPYRGHFHARDAILFLGGAVPSSVAAAALGALLWRRGRRRSAVLWPALFALAVGIEVLSKLVVLERPALFAWRDGVLIHVAAFDTSFPSGHALRATILAGLVAVLWPRLAPLAALWAAAVAVLLEVGGIHTPTDIAGGLLLGGGLVLVARQGGETARA
jgi:membrane-associated phospholipid phosphatase